MEPSIGGCASARPREQAAAVDARFRALAESPLISTWAGVACASLVQSATEAKLLLMWPSLWRTSPAWHVVRRGRTLRRRRVVV